MGVNLLWCRPGQVGGSEEYLARQLVGLASVAPEIGGRLVVPPGFPEAHPDLVDRFEIVVGPEATRRRRSSRILAEARSLPSMLGAVDVVHHAGGTLPARPRLPRPRTPTVLTIHDVQYLRFPEYFSAARHTYLRLRVPASLRQADVICVPSEFVKGSVVAAFGVDGTKVVVVPHGFDPPASGDLSDAQHLRDRFGLGDRRVLMYPAITHPHKGHRFLIELLAGPWSDRGLVLVLLGGRGAAEEAVAQAIRDAGLTDRVVRPGRVPDADRDGLVALAEAIVFPSEYEGFGAPVLEAMSLGTPVICSDQAALPEVAGDAAQVLPLRIEAWAGALDVIDADRVGWIERGCRRAAEFTTARSGGALADAYRLAAGARP